MLEVGGGSGTNAVHFLSHLQISKPDFYSRCKYTICEISPVLADMQAKKLEKHGHLSKVDIIVEDFLTWNRPIVEGEPSTAIIALEVLDNLPHDLIKFKDDKWMQTEIENESTETYVPLQDEIIRRAANFFYSHPVAPPSASFSFKKFIRDFKARIATKTRRSAETISGTPNAVFVPSGAVQFLDAVNRNFPAHKLLLADFAFLPFGDVRFSEENSKVAGSLFGCLNAPIVSGKDEKGRRVDYPSYLTPKPFPADIFWPTDFYSLAAAYDKICDGAKDSRVLLNMEFLDEFCSASDRVKTSTKSGYNPMIQVSFFAVPVMFFFLPPTNPLAC